MTQLTYRPRHHTIAGFVGGARFQSETLGHPAHKDILEWEKVQELRSGAALPGAATPKLAVLESTHMAIYDFPGSYAAKSPGEADPRVAGNPLPAHGGRSHVVWIKVRLKTGIPDFGFHIHGTPHCGHPRCIVVAQNWIPLFDALKAVKQVSLAIEL